MLTTEERMHELKHRTQKYRRRKSLCITKLSCVMLCVGLVLMAWHIGNGKPHCADIHGMCGSALLFEDSGGYVLVATAAFILAVVVTLLCLHYKKKSNEKNYPIVKL